MARAKPFSAIRPTRDKVHLVASRSYVSYSAAQLRKKLHDNPFSFLHIIHPDMGSKKMHKLPLEERFQLVRRKYESFIQESILTRDSQPCYYLYSQVKKGHRFTGIIAAVSIDDYLSGHIRIHEQTLSKRQELFTTYLENTAINAEPVLLIGEKSHVLDGIFQRYMQKRPEYDFTQMTRVQHQLWVIDEPEDTAAIERAFDGMSNLYIADGHHRSASSAALCLKKRKENPDYNGREPWNYFLSYILDESNVRIYEFNRLVSSLNGLSDYDFFDLLGEKFLVNETSPLARPCAKGEFVMYFSKKWYSLRLRNNDSQPLDAQVLSDHILDPILGIKDLKKDKRISFLEGPQGLESMQHLVDKGKYKVAFALHPVAIEELKRIADNNDSMPPKSTWIEPKLRSGLVIYDLAE
ncbi:MAG: hypothetical protein RL220_977 [Bacteroidota bacterium]